MWQLEWATEPAARPSERWPADPPPPQSDQAEISRVGGLMWEEHCHECAAPDCYRTCPLFVRRADGKCARFEYGIHPNRQFSGLFPFGADVRFRRWAKLESVIPVGRMPTWVAPRLAVMDQALATQARRIDAVRRPSERRRATSAYGLARLSSLRAVPTSDFDDFLIEAWSPEEEPFRLAVEAKRDGTPYFRESVVIQPGWNRFTFPAAAVLSGAVDRSCRLLVYPEADATVRVVFTWLDLVRYEPAPSPGSSPAPRPTVGQSAAPDAARILKCVVWDLDGTLWDGVLADVGPDAVMVSEDVRELIRELDARGIVQSVASKNDFDSTWRVLTKLGLDQMFLYPAIHWGPKSESIRQIAKSLNIGLDAMGFIDDSPIERAEVQAAVPQVRVYDSQHIAQLLSRAEFDVQPTDEGRQRRLSYLVEMERQKTFSASSAVSIEEFLRSCALTVALFEPAEGSGLERCHELLLRSNQLNLSTRRHSRDELSSLVADPRYAPLAVSVRDRFGDYGVVGFLLLGAEDDASLWVHDFVLSCRVAKKYVENAILEAVRAACADLTPTVHLRFVPSARNGPLLEALRSTGMSEVDREPQGELQMTMDTTRPVLLSDVVNRVEISPAAESRIRGVSAGAEPTPGRRSDRS